ncbi:IgGFc-binding protein-like [Ostrea edulis]|uniref:IgGFc-binding protein-like n=1 Tax=Ostrea edulis TaxID=37623 RepID=UPI0024AFD47B|nr:IgGFc-binding protein-like [Ostrea edulis]
MNSLWRVLILLPLANCALDSRGTHFLIAFLDNFTKRQDISPEIFITTASNTPVHVHVTSPGTSNPHVNQSFVVSRGIVHQLTVSPDFRLNHTEMSHKAIEITANKDIVVYGVNREVHSDDGYLALPTDVLGSEYYTISYAPSYHYCVFAVIATENNTHVAIKLPSHRNVSVSYRHHTYHRNQWINVTMNRYDTFQISSVGDLTGSHVISDYPVGVISGNKKTIVGNTGNSRDHLTEMLLPIRAWGKNFVTVPIPERNVGDIFRFVASQDNTEVNITGKINGTLFSEHFIIRHAGSHAQKMYSSFLYSHVVASKPIALYEFSVTQNRHENSDPSLITVPPIEQYATDYTFTTPKYSLGQYQNYFMFVTDAKHKGGLLLDGHRLPHEQKYVHIPGTHLVGGYISIAEGTHTVSHSNPSTTIGAILFGKANRESYGFPIGLLMAPINSGCRTHAMTIGDEIDNDCDGEVDEEHCDGKDSDGDGRIDEDCMGEEITSSLVG